MIASKCLRVYMAGLGVLSMWGCGSPSVKDSQWVTIDAKTASLLRAELPDSVQLVDSSPSRSVMTIANDSIGKVGAFMHETTHRCGGYFAFDNEEDAVAFHLNGDKMEQHLVGSSFTYTIDQNEVVNSLLAQVEPQSIIQTINHLSSYHNRYYTAASGSDSQNWLLSHWQELGQGRSDFSVELFQHNSWPQPSVIATIQGTEFPDEIIVIGGHGDSISGWFNQDRASAPGGDDNASGIASITEALRVLLKSDWRPKRTLKFMSYAAEEVGLKGSKEVARSFQASGKQVMGVMQLDMTAHVGARKLIGLMRDHTDDGLSDFTGALLNEYITEAWINDQCGYACSDHASWTAAGYPSVMPFEATYDETNSKIHTANDTISNADNTGEHSKKFSQLAIAFLVEISK
ncbi:MAG: M20/M25/M40 family metallo-hydrolase [Bdellovibrionota bacterium]